MTTQVVIRHRDNSFREKLGRYVAGQANDPDCRPKAMITFTAKMAAVIKTGAEYRLFVGRADARWNILSLQSREGGGGVTL